MYRDLTRDHSVAVNHISKEVDDRMRVIPKLCEPAVLRDLYVNNVKTANGKTVNNIQVQNDLVFV